MLESLKMQSQFLFEFHIFFFLFLFLVLCKSMKIELIAPQLQQKPTTLLEVVLVPRTPCKTFSTDIQCCLRAYPASQQHCYCLFSIPQAITLATAYCSSEGNAHTQKPRGHASSQNPRTQEAAPAPNTPEVMQATETTAETT